MTAPEAEAIPTTIAEQLVSPESEQVLKAMSDSFARGDGYDVDFVVDPSAPTFSTMCSVDEKGVIKVGLSPELLKRVDAEDRLEFLGYGVLHELGHVKRFQAQPPRVKATAKDEYFSNVIDDIAINYGNAKRTRFVHDMTGRVYDKYMAPKEVRPELAHAPRHQQLMDSLLVLSMTTNAHTDADTNSLLAEANLVGLDDEVVSAIGEVLAYQRDSTTYNLLGQLRAFGDSIGQTANVAAVIREHFDKLYEEDKADQQEQSSDKGNDGQLADSEGEVFDYSDSAACNHEAPGHEHSQPSKVGEKSNKDGQPDKPDKSKNGEKTDGSAGAESGQESGNTPPVDIEAVIKEITDQIKQAIPEAQAKATIEDRARDFTPEQLEKLRQELNLTEEDFEGYLASRKQFAGEIRAVEDILLQLRHERQNEFLAPGREVAARGHRVKVDRLVKAIASASLGDQPDIWKHPAMVERIEHEFDGLDLYLLCDVSTSMHGSKAEAAASSAVVLQEGLLSASAQMAGEQAPVVRLQVQAFGEGHQMLSELTDEPSLPSLGKTYSALRNPSSGDTLVSGALGAIKPEAGRLSVVAVVSDGSFHDNDLAKIAGQKLADQNTAIIQLVFGGASVDALADSAKRINLNSARDLPEQLLNMLPELLDLIRRNQHA